MQTLSLMLSELGFAVYSAVDGEGGTQAALEILPDVALIDIDLPGISGYDVVGQLKGTPHTARIKLIAVTGYGQATDHNKAYEAVFDKHLTKPVSIEELAKAMNIFVKHTSRNQWSSNTLSQANSVLSNYLLRNFHHRVNSPTFLI